MSANQLPADAVVRVSRGTFDPARFAEVTEMSLATGRYLIPAIEKLPGLISYYAGVSPDGSMVNVSIWDSEEHAQQMSRLTEMTVDARREADKAGVTIAAIINHHVTWSI